MAAETTSPCRLSSRVPPAPARRRSIGRRSPRTEFPGVVERHDGLHSCSNTPMRGSDMSRRVGIRIVTAAVVCLFASCATSKIVQQNAQRVYNGQPLDKTGLHEALVSDTKDVQANLQSLQRKFAEALSILKTNVQKRWGQGDTKVAERTVYVKYTQGYKSRVITDFDHGSLTVETLEEKDPEGSLKTAIVAALLTSNDPAAVDLFSDKDVALEPSRKPYLFGLVHDNHGKSVSTR